MKKQKLTEAVIIEYWLKKYHDTTIKGVVEKYPKLYKTPKWYKKYPLTQQQHDEWYDWVIKTLMKEYKYSKTRTMKSFALSYLNCAPSIKK